MKRTLVRARTAVRAGLKTMRDHWRAERYSAPFQEPLSPVMLEATRRIRGDYPSALLIHGVQPRSGTVYCGRLLRAHPDLHAYPNQIWEMPLLQALPAVEALQEAFINGYKQNRERIARHDFLALVGSAFIGYLYAQVPPGKRLLMKVPLAHHLAQFRLMFPHEDCLMLMRDGRDLTASTLKTWPERDFAQVAQAWTDAASYMLSLDLPLYRYEDIVADPHTQIRAICERYGLDPDRYPYETIAAQPLKGSSEFVKDKGWDAVAQPQSFKSVGRWTSWSASQKSLFKRIAGDALVRAGYARDAQW